MHSHDQRCFKCKHEPMARGIRGFRCARCQLIGVTNVRYGGICSNCADELDICVKCGDSINRTNDNLRYANETLIQYSYRYPQLAKPIKLITDFITETLDK